MTLSGTASIIDYDAGEVLYMSVRNKYCSQCENDIRNGKPLDPDGHGCCRNWGRDQASTAMEADIILQGFLESIKSINLYIKFLLLMVIATSIIQL